MKSSGIRRRCKLFYRSCSTFQLLLSLVRIAVNFKPLGIVKKYEKIRNKDDEFNFKAVYQHFTTNKVIIEDFVRCICEQYFDNHSKNGLLYSDFKQVAASNQYWFINPNLIREEFLVYALRNSDRALEKIKQGDEKVFGAADKISSLQSGHNFKRASSFGLARLQPTSKLSSSSPGNL